jgi:hypothetical protein
MTLKAFSATVEWNDDVRREYIDTRARMLTRQRRALVEFYARHPKFVVPIQLHSDVREWKRNERNRACVERTQRVRAANKRRRVVHVIDTTVTPFALYTRDNLVDTMRRDDCDKQSVCVPGLPICMFSPQAVATLRRYWDRIDDAHRVTYERECARILARMDNGESVHMTLVQATDAVERNAQAPADEQSPGPSQNDNATNEPDGHVLTKEQIHDGDDTDDLLKSIFG